MNKKGLSRLCSCFCLFAHKGICYGIACGGVLFLAIFVAVFGFPVWVSELFEKRMEASAPRNMLALTQGVYSKALRVEPAAMGDLPSEEIRRYPDKYESVGKHAWKRSGSGVAPRLHIRNPI